MNTFLSVIMTFLSAEGADFTELSDAITGLINSMWVPCVAVASAFAVAWGLYLGIKYWLSAGDEQKKRSAKSSLISFVVGTIIIFVVAVGAPMGIGALTEWVKSNNAYSVAALASSRALTLLS